MIKLYGLKFSNYYSLTKALMIYKGVEFEEVKAPPTQEEDNLRRTPMGKMPSIEVDGKFLSESLAIAALLDRQNPEPALLPEDPWEAAKVIELVCHVKLDLELVARRCLPELLFNQPVSEETKEQVSADLDKGMAALQRILVCGPYAAGDSLTLADFYMFYCFSLIKMIAQAIFQRDILDGYDDLAALLERLAEQPAIAQTESEK